MSNFNIHNLRHISFYVEARNSLVKSAAASQVNQQARKQCKPARLRLKLMVFTCFSCVTSSEFETAQHAYTDCTCMRVLHLLKEVTKITMLTVYYLFNNVKDCLS